MDNLEEMNKFLERYNIPKLNQDEIDSMKRPIAGNETISVILKCPAKRKDNFIILSFSDFKTYIVCLHY